MKMILKVGRWVVGLFILLLAIAGMAEGDWLMAMLVAFIAFLVLPTGDPQTQKKENSTNEKAIKKVMNNNKKETPTRVDRILTDSALNNTASRSQPVKSLSFHLPLAREAHDSGDYDGARFYYQKIGFANHQVGKQSDLRKYVLQEQVEFAKDDPLYKRIVKKTRKILLEEDCIKQTELYKRLSDSKEDVQYALYFADETGDLVRRKQGRTYLISL